MTVGAATLALGGRVLGANDRVRLAICGLRGRGNDPAGERAQRYTEELAELREKATLAQDKVTAFRKENGIGDMNSATTGTEVQALDTLHQRLLDTQNRDLLTESVDQGFDLFLIEGLSLTAQ